jgi:hypothetical protein
MLFRHRSHRGPGLQGGGAEQAAAHHLHAESGQLRPQGEAHGALQASHPGLLQPSNNEGLYKIDSRPSCYISQSPLQDYMFGVFQVATDYY